MTNQTLLTLASKLILASTTGDDGALDNVAAELIKELQRPYDNKDVKQRSTSDNEITGFLKFTVKEISKMPKSIRRTFIAEGQTICYRRRKRGKLYAAFTYEARYRRHGYNISVSARDLEELKARFIQALHAAEAGNEILKVPTNFDEFSAYWFNNFHKRKVKANSYDHDIKLYDRHIKPAFGKLRVTVINPVAIQKFLDGFTDRPKTAQDLYSVLNQIFDCALKHGLIKLNPLGMCFRIQYEKEHGALITKDEETTLLSTFRGTEWELPFAVVCYTGLRPDEYTSATIDGHFIKAKNSKHGKNGETVYKRIPISPMLRPFLVGVGELHLPKPRVLNNRFKKVLPGHKLYDMRTTFQTRCTECGIPDNVIGVFMGNSIGKLKDAYTSFSDDYLLKEGEKLNY